MAKYAYTKTRNYFKGPLLTEEIIAVLDVTPYVETAPDGGIAYLTVPDDVEQASLDALIEAHDSSTQSSAEKANEQNEIATIALNTLDVNVQLAEAAAAVTPDQIVAHLIALWETLGHIITVLGFPRSLETDNGLGDG